MLRRSALSAEGRYPTKFNSMKKILLLAALLLPLLAAATDVTVKSVTVTVPEGFDGPLRQAQGPAVHVGYTKESGPIGQTTFQVTVIDIDPALKFDGVPARERPAAEFLLDFASSMQRTRTAFNRTEPVSLVIGGIPAAKLRWTGKLEDVETVGTMYAIVAGDKVIHFNTQDVGPTPTPAMLDAESAFEAAKVSPCSCVE